MSDRSCWNTVPADILQRAFELQREGLANYGAASSCVAWRNVARNSRVNHLHLHAATDEQEQSWPRLLARKRIDTLKLTTQRIHGGGIESYATNRAEVVAEATVSSIPIACRSLYLSEFAAYGLEQYTSKSPQVQQLSIQWNGLQAGRNSFHLLPSFAALHQLTELTVHMRNDFDGEVFPFLVDSCPDSVESLILEGFGSLVEDDEQPPARAVRSLTLLEDNLPALTRLELAHSAVRILGEGITCLSKLKSLSLCHSEIYVDGQLEVTLLTRLTHLDLAEATCYWEDAWVDALDTFTAWPALAVLKAYKCNIFDMNTVMDVPSVREIHVGHFSHFADPGPDQQAHVHAHAHQVISYDCKRASSIVGLTVGTSYDRPLLDSLLAFVAAHCRLERLVVLPCPGLPCPGQLLSFPGEAFSHLRHLAITGVKPSEPSVDLQALLCLTSLELTDIDTGRLVKSIELPSKLEVFTFVGFSLFLSGFKHNLHALPFLTKIVLCTSSDLTGDVSLVPSPCLPQLPLGLCHLVLAGTMWCRPDCDWSGLQGCPNLQHLTLAIGQQVFGQLEEWIRSARCLYIVDYLEDQDEWSSRITSHISRLPQLWEHAQLLAWWK